LHLSWKMVLRGVRPWAARNNVKGYGSRMPDLDRLFVTTLYRAELAAPAAAAVAAACRAIADEDQAGRAWAKAHAYKGYTSYASLADLVDRAPEFGDLRRGIDAHVAAFARAAQLDLGRRRLKFDSMWINVLKPGGVHTGHIHPHSAVSGTYYASMPKGGSAIRFEDPRLGLMMAAPPRLPDAAPEHRTFVSVAPTAGTVLLWESWLRHEVPLNAASQDRISVSFNYRWG
jgi:uncharacterized protein (TIGR02466 family)